ncbi:MAG TPA: hypothetical protein VFO37_04895 [Chitinophagaceae bacterium]|nr:hypothetical protein [Chitinophagaceae bacterium]
MAKKLKPPPEPTEEEIKERARKEAEEIGKKRTESRQEGRRYAEEVLSRDIQGYTPAQRRSMEEGGKRRIGREFQGYQRQLLAQQGRRGLRGGAAYAQQADLARGAQEAQQQMMQDIEQSSADAALKKLAAMFSIEQGEAAQSSLDRQLALEEIRLEQERKRQRMYEDKYFKRV